MKRLEDEALVVLKVEWQETRPAKIKGIIRGLPRNGSKVWKGMRIGDIDPRDVNESVTPFLIRLGLLQVKH